MNLLIDRVKNYFVKMLLKGKTLPDHAKMNLQSLDHVDRSKKATSYRYVVFDLETTGIDYRNEQIISIGAFRIVDGKIQLKDVFHEFANPGRRFSAASVVVHGIVPDMVAKSRSVNEVMDDFLKFIGTDILVAHHIDFDLQFINKIMSRMYGFPIQNLTLDTSVLYKNIMFWRHVYKYNQKGHDIKYDLDAVANFLGISLNDRHTCIGDALAAAMIFQRILSEIECKGCGSLNNLIKSRKCLFDFCYTK